LKEEKLNSFERALGAGDAGPHPDANVLTAFAEDALLPRERASVLAHAAHCAECREVLSLAAGPQAVMSPEVSTKWTGWYIVGPLLAAAALIAVVSSLVLRHGATNPPQNITVANNAKGNASPPVQPTTSSPSPDKAASSHKERPQELRKETAPIVPSNTIVMRPEHAPKPREGDMQAARVPAAKLASPSPRVALQTPAQASAFANTVTAHALASASADSIARPHWRINEQGQPERAFGNGAWKPVLPGGSAKMRSLAVFEGEVWVGGEKSQLFRSIDNGTSWRVIALPEKEGADHTIVHIRFSSSQEVTIEAADGTAWATTDGGATWK
jgi:hypothetical protein